MHTMEHKQTNEELVEQGLETLRANQFKITQKRKEILELFAQKQHYMSAQDVHEILREKYPTMSYNTTYRNLYDFVECDLLETTEYRQQQLFKIHCIGDHHHHHFICTKCGKSIPIHHCPMHLLEDELQGVQIEFHRFEVFGLCADCQ
ncbi:transcriptional repressor [Suicoccus acidiformans]|uniref:Transcriptional repressor n=1 Tax=Suicoccus acidiformans TaxID=2036206 RepID=A0A347WNU3_9LACT|nr:transcriptional repressor [Suicoccus acidiformans]AXY26750.1 transcriptional repressor [Suicoccus acidiformans]